VISTQTRCLNPPVQETGTNVVETLIIQVVLRFNVLVDVQCIVVKFCMLDGDQGAWHSVSYPGNTQLKQNPQSLSCSLRYSGGYSVEKPI